MARGLDAVGIISKDIEKSIAFYSCLGVQFTKSGEGHYEGETSSGIRIMLDSVELIKKINPKWIEGTGSRIVLCFKEENANLVNSVFSKIIDSGFKSIKEPWDAFWGQRYSCVQDPDGNQIDIFAEQGENK